MEPNSSAGKYKVIPIFLYPESNILEDKGDNNFYGVCT